jgi:hypothetical protein
MIWGWFITYSSSQEADPKGSVFTSAFAQK